MGVSAGTGFRSVSVVWPGSVSSADSGWRPAGVVSLWPVGVRLGAFQAGAVSRAVMRIRL